MSLPRFRHDGPASGPEPRRAPPALHVAAAILAVAFATTAGCGTSPVKPRPRAAAPPPPKGAAASAPAAAAGAGGGGAPPAGAGGASTGPTDFCGSCTLQSGCLSVANNAIDEASGLAASALHDGAFYLHNDSGDSPRFFATNCQGDDLGTFSLTGATAVDWEDMARGPCDPAAGGARASCLYFADIGDNSEVRTDYVVYRAFEPTALGAGPHQVPAAKLPFAYPDGSHDAEALLVHPLTGEMAIVTKVERGASGVYVFPTPHTPDVVAVLTKVADVMPPTGSVRFTAGAVHPSAQGIVLRTYTNLFFYAMAQGQTLGAALSAPPCDVPVMLELQGESVSFTASGTGYVTISEKTAQQLHFAACE